MWPISDQVFLQCVSPVHLCFSEGKGRSGRVCNTQTDSSVWWCWTTLTPHSFFCNEVLFAYSMSEHCIVCVQLKSQCACHCVFLEQDSRVVCTRAPSSSTWWHDDNVARLCSPPLSTSLERRLVRPNYVFWNQTKWLLFVSTTLFSSIASCWWRNWNATHV